MPLTKSELRQVLEVLEKGLAKAMTIEERQLQKQALVAAELSFFLGQRIGDTLQLLSGACSRLQLPDLDLLCVLYRRGKTTRRRQPFTVHTPYDMKLSRDLLGLQEATSRGKPLFPDVDRVATKIRDAIHQVAPQCCLLSLCKEGLQEMAIQGASIEVLLHHSRHSSVEMLDRYLPWGKLNLAAARSRFADGKKSVEATV